MLGGEGPEEEVGDSVALSANGTTALAGARFAHSGAGTAYVYQTGPHAPAVVTGFASSVGPTSAVLEATVNPNAQEVTECKFEYGPTISYENSIPCSSYAAFNIGWRERPRRRIDSFIAPRGCLTRPGMANQTGDHSHHYPGFPA